MTKFARAERDSLCDDLLVAGPDAPTLCSGWTTRDLATHLVIRDGRPDLIIGPKLPVVGERATKALREITNQPWPQLVAAVRSGPPRFSPAAIGAVDELINHVEFFVHHEDVLRSQPGTERRRLSSEQQRALWSSLTKTARLMFRKSPVGVELVSPLGRHTAKAATDQGSVTLEGDPSELLLFAFGRQGRAEVTPLGAQAAIDALLAAKLGLA